MDSALDSWQNHVAMAQEFDGVSLASTPDVSKAGKWRYWRVSLEDGTKVIVNISDKVSGKALLQVNHEKLPDKEAVERCKTFWKDVLKNMSASQVPR